MSYSMSSDSTDVLTTGFTVILSKIITSGKTVAATQFPSDRFSCIASWASVPYIKNYRTLQPMQGSEHLNTIVDRVHPKLSGCADPAVTPASKRTKRLSGKSQASHRSIRSKNICMASVAEILPKTTASFFLSTA